jgi:hypothetical protein
MWRLAREAYGADYPGELQPWGVTTWWTLGRFISGLRVGAGQHLLDLACGRGGVGLWLARATGAQLTCLGSRSVAERSRTALTCCFLVLGRGICALTAALRGARADGLFRLVAVSGPWSRPCEGGWFPR